jgi:polyhydroxyalkanoate synthase
MNNKHQSKSDYAESIDKALQVAVGRMTNGLSPAAYLLAFMDWYFHLAIHPAKQLELLDLYQENMQNLLRLFIQNNTTETNEIKPELKSDRRFADPQWQSYPYQLISQQFLMMQDWWQQAATDVRGVNQHHADVVGFSLRQICDMLSPSNFPWLNPEIQKKATESSGENFVNGFENFLDDLRRYQNNEPPAGAENFVVGTDVAVTAGYVIYRNELIELIQYSPKTNQVYAEPVLITPAWIMKYYILDLTPKHSLVNYLVKKGHTVFMISWKNPREEDRHLGMDDYLNLGILSAIDVISTVVPKQKIHLVGYCLGGTLAAIATATMAREQDARLASMTLFAAQTDFTEPGELGLFIDESEISFLENLMDEKGYLDTHQMAGAFQLLRSNDLIWSRIVREYMMGERKPLSDLMAWNADATRLPFRMHSEYLRRLFLNNQLATGTYLVNDRPIALADIDIPIFVVATERDHVSPWHSVFKINLLTTCDVTFVLTSGGHNVGIVSMPVKKTKRHYRIETLRENDHYVDPDRWYKNTKPTGGSWWPAFEKWLVEHSSGKIAPPTMGSKQTGYVPIEPAPGRYVLEK